MSQHYLGIDLGGTKTEVIVLNQASDTCLRFRRPTPQSGYPDLLDHLVTLVTEAEARLGLPPLPVGLGIPGTLSRVSGRVKNANTQCLNGQTLQTDLSQRLQRPVAVMNDANCLAVSEAVDGAGTGKALVFAAILGTGCGAGLAYQGQALSGPNGLCGEWGHIPMPGASDAARKQRPCYCGRHGCIETFLSGTGLQLSHQLRGGAPVPVEALVEQASAGDQRAQQVLADYHQQLLDGLTLVINVLDPDIIVLGGGVSNLPSLYPFLQQHLPTSVFGRECDTPVVPARHGDASGVRGAAWLNRPTLGKDC